MKAHDYYPGVKKFKWYPEDLAGLPIMTKTNQYWYVDYAVAASGGGQSWEDAYKTIQEAVTAASAWDVIFVAPRSWEATGTDPYNYAESVIIPRSKEYLQIIGAGTGRVQGGLPQLKQSSSTASPLLTIRAPGVLIANMGFNGTNSTIGGILLDDDSGATKTAFGTTIINCHFKNCRGTSATNAATGGAIVWSANGQASQTLIKGCKFYKCVGDVVLLGTSEARPQDVVIEDCIFSGPAASVDCNLYLAGGSGINGLYINNCIFPAMPALGGTNDRYCNLTGCVGTISNSHFASIVDSTGTEVTFAADGTGGVIPATVHIMNCRGESTTVDKLDIIFRT